jgi:hypothetical protein
MLAGPCGRALLVSIGGDESASKSMVFTEQPENRVGCHSMSAGRTKWEWSASAVVIASMLFLLTFDKTKRSKSAPIENVSSTDTPPQ